MKITLRLFGSLREALGESTIQVELAEGARVVDVRRWLSERSSVVEELGDRLAASVNLEIANAQVVLSDGDEVAFLPPPNKESKPWVASLSTLLPSKYIRG